MYLPTIRGVIERRILLNYRVHPEAIARILPKPFRPQLVGGSAIAGICLIRLKEIRPRFAPRWVGLASENAAHRIAVEWDEHGSVRKGVYIPCRHTSSRLNSLVGGRLFPGVHYFSQFSVCETESHFQVSVQNSDNRTVVDIDATLVDTVSGDSIFDSTDEAADFFQAGSLGYSPAGRAGCFDGLRLACEKWELKPLAINRVVSNFFEDRTLFQEAEIELDSAFLMRNVPHAWENVAQKKAGQSSANML